MALDNYANFKAAITRMTGRNDISDIVDDALNIADKEIYANPEQPLRIRNLETRSTASVSTSSRFLALPGNFIHMRRLKLQLSGGDADVEYRTPEQLEVYGTSGIPKFFTVTSQLEFDRTPDSAYTAEMQYFQRLAIISDSNTTNDILTNFPNIYVYGTLAYLYKFAAEEEKSQFYYQEFIKAIAGANKQDRRGRYGASPIMRIEGCTP